MAALLEKKEADLSGKRSPRSGTPRKFPSADRKGKGKEKVNGNHADLKGESASENAEGEKDEKEGTPEA